MQTYSEVRDAAVSAVALRTDKSELAGTREGQSDVRHEIVRGSMLRLA